MLRYKAWNIFWLPMYSVSCRPLRGLDGRCRTRQISQRGAEKRLCLDYLEYNSTDNATGGNYYVSRESMPFSDAKLVCQNMGGRISRCDVDEFHLMEEAVLRYAWCDYTKHDDGNFYDSEGTLSTDVIPWRATEPDAWDECTRISVYHGNYELTGTGCTNFPFWFICHG